jgi:exonuclease VII small subunit
MDFEESIAVATQVIKKLEKEDIGLEVLGEELWRKFCAAFQDA